MIRRGDDSADNEIFQYLESIFESDINRIKEYVDIPKGTEIEKEIEQMTGLGESLYNKAYNKASREKTISILRKNYHRNHNVELTIQDLQEELEIDYEEAKDIFEKEIMK